ncbi:hypothetical protein [Enterococcus rivorum]|uniref:Uncharacterized protein n=1 Tax=Enterococcus rivorum TaxID=762845 RepID=A0A1E5KUC7_9ENTE|nr:hypothetical protein [Enterococcus rivorum]MBP2098931.1 hypothetical protein [Enterococcus rivorum]OEH81470.1 hypothetical protein BCR26_04285 [Enterococcus rivorum]
MCRINQAIQLLMEQQNIKTEADDLGQESVLFMKEELDEETLPKKAKEKLPTIVMSHTFFYLDNQGVDYIVYFLAEGTTNQPVLCGILKEGELVYSKWLNA